MEFCFDLPLREASAQEIQLELLRRTQHNALDGERVAASLLRHRELWLSVLLDRQYVWTRNAFQFPILAMIKLRDLPQNHWNADTLFVLTEDVDKARRLAQVARDDHWAGAVLVHEDSAELRGTLGTSREGFAIVTVWWD